MKKMIPLLFAALLMAASLKSYAQAKFEPLVCYGIDDVSPDTTDSLTTCYLDGKTQRISFRQLYQRGYRLIAVDGSWYHFEKQVR